MRRSQFGEQELRLEAERFVQYRGTARVRLDVLDFQWNEPRELSRKNVERLKEFFRGEKRSYENMRRLDPRNHIPAVVEQSDLDDALRASEVSAERLLSNPDNDPPSLRFAVGYHLTCLHGRHRIQAAREILPPTDAWWAVDLYLADAHPELRTTLVEEYANEAKPSDGEIYRKAHLSDHGRRGLRQLRDHGDGEFVAAFDRLLEISGLWDGMRISTLHKLFDLRCDEEAQHYLELIRTTMHRIFRLVLHKDKTALQRVDQVTIKALELRVPRYSRRDAQVLQGQVLSGQICSLFSREEREAIWTTGEADAQRYRPHGARAEFPYTDEASGRHVVEVAESVFVDRSGPAVDRFDLGYRHLWAFAMREYLEVPTDAKKKSKDLLAKAGVQRADEEVLSRAANLAYKIGFVSDEIQALRERSSDREIAYNALLKARKPGRYQYDQTVLEANIAHIVRLFATATPLATEESSPVLVCDDPDAAGNRCGFPDKDTQRQDSKHLFIPHLHAEGDEKGEEITSFFVRRSVYFAFFGKLPDLGLDICLSPPRQPQHTRTASRGLNVDGIEPSQRESPGYGEFDRLGREGQEQERLVRSEESQGRQDRQDRLVQQEQERHEQEIREEMQRQETRAQGHQQEERLKDARKRYTQIDLENIDHGSLGDQSGLFDTGPTQDPQQTQQDDQQDITDQSGQEMREPERSEPEMLEQERLKQEQKRQEQERQEQERQEQERLELRRIEERLQRDDLQERLAQDLRVHQNLEQEKQRQQQHDKQQHEREEEERRRQETRERGRRQQEALVEGRSLDDSQRARKRRELVVADPELNVVPTLQESIRERLERETLARERLEQERPDRERLEREELQESLAQKLREQGNIDQEQREQKKRAQEQEQWEVDRRKGERKRRERREQERWEQEKTIESEGAAQPPELRPRRRQGPQATQTPDSVWITFKAWERGVWRTAQSLHVYSSDPSEVERIAVKYMRKKEQMRVYDTDLNILAPQMCYQAAVDNGSNILLLIPEKEIDINEELEASVSRLLSESNIQLDANVE